MNEPVFSIEKGCLHRPATNGRGGIHFTATESYQLWALLTANLKDIQDHAHREQKRQQAQELSLELPFEQRVRE